jgi:tRNA (cytidine32/guanosine34-2'-O)-methyltransferase
MLNPLLDQKYASYDELEGSNRIIVPFMACGDLNTQYDSDKTYPLIIDGKNYSFSSPINPPINPPYQQAKYLKQNNLIGKSETNFQDLNSNENSNEVKNHEKLTDSKQDLNSNLSDLTISN